MSSMQDVLKDTFKEYNLDEALLYTAEYAQLFEQMEKAHQAGQSFKQEWSGFCRHVLSAILRTSDPPQLERWLHKSQIDDLYLAYSCLQGSSEALQALQIRYNGVLKPIVKRFAKPPLMPDELQQELWIRLFVSTEKRVAKIASYAGQGALASWLRVTAVRACIDYTRTHPHLKQEKIVEKDRIFELPDQAFDIELTFLKNEYRAHFREAFEEAVRSLSSHDRLLLRYHVVQGLSIDQIGALFQFHRSTAARQLRQARQNLLQETERHLIQKLRISPNEFASIMRLIQSRWEVSVQRLLAQSHI